MDCVDHADGHIWIEIFQDFTDGPSGNLQEEFQQRGRRRRKAAGGRRW
jgi:hypothetical protein